MHISSYYDCSFCAVYMQFICSGNVICKLQYYTYIQQKCGQKPKATWNQSQKKQQKPKTKSQESSEAKAKSQKPNGHANWLQTAANSMQIRDFGSKMQQIQARSQKPKEPEAKSQKPKAKSQKPTKKNAKKKIPLRNLTPNISKHTQSLGISSSPELVGQSLGKSKGVIFSKSRDMRMI